MKDNHLSAEDVTISPERNAFSELPWSKGNIKERIASIESTTKEANSVMSLRFALSLLPTLSTHFSQLKTQG